MRYLVNEKEMKQIDRDTIEGTGIPSMVLMERAALAVVEEIRQRVDAPSVLCVCGCGNNGADGLAIARILAEADIVAHVLILGNEERATAEWKQQREIIENLSIPVVTNPDVSEYTVIVDALFGIGLGRDIEGRHAEWIEKINNSGACIVSVDMPSGIATDSGEVRGIAIKADLTVTFGLLKAGLVFYPGAEYAGEVIVKQIGFPKQNIEKAEPKLYTFGKEDLNMLPVRKADLHKGRAGKILILAGSRNMAGAAILSAKAAYRMGAGLVKIMTPELNREIIQTALPEAVLVTYEGKQEPEERQTFEKMFLQSLKWADIVVAGPGLGQTETAYRLIKALSGYATEHKEKRYVLDADALNLLAAHRELWKGFADCAVITPHMGEMAAILDTSVCELQKNRIALAKSVGMEYNLICVLKDARTSVCEGDGACYVNTSGNSGMATAGSGDVLTGVIAGCLAMGLPARRAAELGVYLHGLAGDVARERLGEHAVMAQDIAEGVAQVLKAAEDGSTGKVWKKNGDRC